MSDSGLPHLPRLRSRQTHPPSKTPAIAAAVAASVSSTGSNIIQIVHLLPCRDPHPTIKRCDGQVASSPRQTTSMAAAPTNSIQACSKYTVVTSIFYAYKRRQGVEDKDTTPESELRKHLGKGIRSFGHERIEDRELQAGQRGQQAQAGPFRAKMELKMGRRSTPLPLLVIASVLPCVAYASVAAAEGIAIVAAHEGRCRLLTTGDEGDGALVAVVMLLSTGPELRKMTPPASLPVVRCSPW
ncbi:hypothetical protein ACLOJK_018606 [Asimina triloba]